MDLSDDDHLVTSRELDEKLELKFAEFFGQITTYFEQRFESRIQALEDKLDSRFNAIINLLDEQIKRQEHHDQEHASIWS